MGIPIQLEPFPCPDMSVPSLRGIKINGQNEFGITLKWVKKKFRVVSSIKAYQVTGVK